MQGSSAVIANTNRVGRRAFIIALMKRKYGMLEREQTEDLDNEGESILKKSKDHLDFRSS